MSRVNSRTTTKPERRPRYFRQLKLEQKLKRWLALDAALGKLTPHERRRHFDMDTWGTKTDCGTVACAAGHASLNPAVRRMGFRGIWHGTILDFNIAPEMFFGDEMYEYVFTNPELTSVGGVRKKIKSLISQLRKGKTTGDLEENQRIKEEKDEIEWQKAHAVPKAPPKERRALGVDIDDEVPDPEVTG